MKQTEILELAMERIIELKRELSSTDQQYKDLNRKLKKLAYMFAVEEQKERK